MKNSAIETSKCPICEKNVLQKYQRSHFDQNSNVNYKLYECSDCSVQHWSPMKNPGSVWYELDVRYSKRNADPILQANYKHKRVVSYFLKILKGNEIGNFKIFDIGCGVGNFLAFANKFGFDCTGIDFDRDGIEAGKKTFKLNNLFVDDLYSYKEKNQKEKFNLVTFFDVFEHIEDHNHFTETVKEYLNDGGYIALSTPYKHAAQWLMPFDLPPRHLTRWDIETQTNFFKKRGFEVVNAVKIPAKIHFIMMKLRFKYGKLFNFGLVSKVKSSEARVKYINEQGNNVVINNQNFKIKIVQTLATVKDIVIFGLPALLIYISMIGSEKRYVDLCLIAKKVR